MATIKMDFLVFTLYIVYILSIVLDPAGLEFIITSIILVLGLFIFFLAVFSVWYLSRGKESDSSIIDITGDSAIGLSLSSWISVYFSIYGIYSIKTL
jgi:hypothetical protein